MAKFFHQRGVIRRLYPNTYKTLRLDDVTIIRDGMIVVLRQLQHWYFVNVDGINNVFHIISKNFKVEQLPLNIFNAELQATEVPVAAPPDAMM